MENKLGKGIVFSPKFGILVNILTFNIKSWGLRLDLIAENFVLFTLPQTHVQLRYRRTDWPTAIPQYHMHKPSISILTVPHFTDYISLEKPLRNLSPAIYTGDIHSGTEFVLHAVGQKSTRSPGRMLGKRWYSGLLPWWERAHKPEEAAGTVDL